MVRACSVPYSLLGCNWHAGYLDESFHACHHNGIREIDAEGCFTFGFVRHPATYYQSFWCYQMKRGWRRMHQLQTDSFEKFVCTALEEHPHGWVSGIYRRLLGEEGEVDFIGKQENLVDDVIAALRLAGESFDEHAVRNHPSKNVSSGLSEWKKRCVYSTTLLREVERLERYAMERFGYSSLVRTSFPLC